MPDKIKTMRYGGTNDLMQTCTRCGESLDRHGIEITSDDRTEKLAKTFQGALDRAVSSGLVKGIAAARASCMVGAAIAKIGSAEYKFVAISGAAVDILNHTGANALGRDVTLIRDGDAFPLTTITGQPLTLAQPVKGTRNRDYPLGACAAQKLLMAIFRKQKQAKGKITSINMSEILWSDPSPVGHNRDWSTGEVVCSCDTCKRVVPIMLCDHTE